MIYELATGQLELHPRAVTFLERVDRGGDASADVALALMPDGPESPVRQEPGVSSGASAVGGVRTEILREQYEVGEDTRDIAEMFGLDVHDVLAALRHEDRLRPLKIACPCSASPDVYAGSWPGTYSTWSTTTVASGCGQTIRATVRITARPST